MVRIPLTPGPARPARNAGRRVEASGVLAYAALGALLLGLAPVVVAVAPAPAAKTPAPAPKPTPTNPFNLNPIPQPSPSLPIIGTTRSKPVCTAIRRAVAPAVAAAMRNDQTYGVLRKTIFDYVVKDSETARDLRLMQMDRTVDSMVKNVDAIEEALKSPTLDIPGTAKPEDAKMLRDLKRTLGGVLAAQKAQLNAMSGFVETERMRRFGKLNETEANLQNSVAPNVANAPSPLPVSGFLHDTQETFNPNHRTPNGLADGHLLDRDLGDIAAVTSHAEDLATKVIVPATAGCK
jgi:hypothetical protein